MTSSYTSSSIVLVLIEIFDDSLTTLVPRYHVTSGLGFALHLHFMVIRVPVSFGMMRGFSMKDGAQPAPSSASWKDPRLDIAGEGTGVVSGKTGNAMLAAVAGHRWPATATPDNVSRVVGSSMSYEAKIQRLHDWLAVARLCLPDKPTYRSRKIARAPLYRAVHRIMHYVRRKSMGKVSRTRHGRSRREGFHCPSG